MQLVRDQHVQLAIPGSVVTVGNFEGLHLGHQALLDKLVAKAKECQLPAWVVTFEPNPKQFLAKNTNPIRLMTFSEKAHQLKERAIDGLYCIRFDKKFAHVSAQDFVTNILKKTLNCQILLVGDDFRFGHQREGTIKDLQQLGELLAFQTITIPPIALNGERISSTLIRGKLASGKVEEVERLLGRPFSFWARVVPGEKRGRLLGFPTANMVPPSLYLPMKGVYHVRLLGLDRLFHGVANLGIRPTVNGKKLLCEAHLFECSEDLYGKKLKVEFLHRIREERRFASLDALREQIKQDVQTAKAMAAYY